MIDYAADLRSTVKRTAAQLREVSDAAASQRPAPGKWSAKEIIGHLIDSAANNHHRFVRAQFANDLVFAGYAQERWVEVQRYQEASWPQLLDLWCSYNEHIAHVIEATDADQRLRGRTPHNLDQIAWQPVSPEEPVTLDYFMRDYVNHLHHHLRQVAALIGGAPTGGLSREGITRA